MIVNNSDLLEHVTSYASQKLPIFPCDKEMPWTKSILDEAINGRLEVENWAEEYHNANIGLATGITYFALEARHVAGLISLHLLEQKFSPLPDTLTMKTGHHRRVYFFKMPSVGSVLNSIDEVGYGLTVHSKGSYVLLPPSIEFNGKANNWENNLSPAAPPTWLIQLLLHTGSIDHWIGNDAQ